MWPSYFHFIAATFVPFILLQTVQWISETVSLLLDILLENKVILESVDGSYGQMKTYNGFTRFQLRSNQKIPYLGLAAELIILFWHCETFPLLSVHSVSEAARPADPSCLLCGQQYKVLLWRNSALWTAPRPTLPTLEHCTPPGWVQRH